MKDYLARLELPSDKLKFTVAEALEATSKALHPDPEPGGPQLVHGVRKELLHPDEYDRKDWSSVLDDKDREVLDSIWANLPVPEFPMTLAAWAPYAAAFKESPQRPNEWSLRAAHWTPEFLTERKRATALEDHREVLRRAVSEAAIQIRNPVSGRESGPIWPAGAETWLLTASEFNKLCTMLAIELVPSGLPLFISTARPVEVPQALLELPPNARVRFQENFPPFFGCAGDTVADYRSRLEARIARQSKGFFTLGEAAQIAAEARTMSAVEVLRRIRQAHSNGLLHIHAADGKFRREPGEEVREWRDLLAEVELDKWLLETTGEGFPKAGSSVAPTLLASVPETPKQRRARLLAMHDAEVSAGRERGALARITEIEKRTRPTADRSNIGKEIRKAREERDAERKGGALTRLLG